MWILMCVTKAKCGWGQDEDDVTLFAYTNSQSFHSQKTNNGENQKMKQNKRKFTKTCYQNIISFSVYTKRGKENNR